MFKENRKKFIDQIGDGVAIIPSVQPSIRSNNMEYPFRQNSNFYYLTGFKEPKSICVISPNHPDHQFVMFVRQRDAEREIWDGKRFGVEGTKENFGVDQVFEFGQFDEKITDYTKNADPIFYTFGNSEFDPKIISLINRNRKTRASKGIGPKSVTDPTEIFAELRTIKNSEEISCIRRAAEITADAHIAAMLIAKPGMFEYELEALIDSIFRRNNGYPAYRTILASGPNATILHYVDNDRKINDNDLILIDAGCEWDFYNADVTRTFPANGKFTEPQRQIYKIVLETQLRLIDMIKPGLQIDKVNERSIELLTEGMLKLGLLDGEREKLIEEKAYRKFYMHGIGHQLGMDVHDVCRTVDGDQSREFAVGMITTVEPGLYIAENSEDVDPKFLGIGVRIEDDVLITENGNEVLTNSIPKTIAEIESACRIK